MLISFAMKCYKIHNNRIFYTTLRTKLQDFLQNERNPNVKGLENRVWKPALKECCDLMEEISTLKVKLSKIHSTFEHCAEENIHKELSDFCKVITEHTGSRRQYREECIFCAAEKITTYFLILRHQKVASLLLQVKDHLSVLGNFEDIRVIAHNV